MFVRWALALADRSGEEKEEGIFKSIVHRGLLIFSTSMVLEACRSESASVKSLPTLSDSESTSSGSDTSAWQVQVDEKDQTDIRVPGFEGQAGTMDAGKGPIPDPNRSRIEVDPIAQESGPNGSLPADSSQAAVATGCPVNIEFSDSSGNILETVAAGANYNAPTFLSSTIARQASVQVKTDNACRITIEQVGTFPFLCFNPALPKCEIMALGNQQVATNCFSGIYFSVNNAPVNMLPFGSHEAVSFGARQTACPELDTCHILGGQGAVLFVSNSVTVQKCADECRNYKDSNPNRSCRWGGDGSEGSGHGIKRFAD